MIIKPNSTNYFTFVFCTVFFFPLFPTVFQSSQVHINIVIFLCCFLPLLVGVKLELKGLHLFIFLYYLCCQLLLIPSLVNDLLNGIASVSSIFSFLRPLLLYVTYLGLLQLIEKCDLGRIITLIKIVIVISFFYVICEIFFIEYFKNIIYLLYKREFRLNLFGVGTTFFGTSYYSGFVFFSLFVFISTSANKVKKNGNIFIAIFAIFLVILSQSKTAILALFIAIVFLSAISNNKLLRFNFYFFIVASLMVVINIENIFDYLAQYNLTIIKQVKVLLFSTAKSDTLNDRIGQIIATLMMVNENWGVFGIGLSPSKSLESWIALFLYRYGTIGIFTFISLCLTLSVFSFKLMRAKNQNAWIGKMGLIWALTLPLTQMSTPMIELSKMAFIANFMLALITIYYKRANNDSI